MKFSNEIGNATMSTAIIAEQRNGRAHIMLVELAPRLSVTSAIVNHRTFLISSDHQEGDRRSKGILTQHS